MGKRKFWPRRSETPENIEAKLGVNDYVMDPYNLANFCGNQSNRVCSPYCWNITYLWLCAPFLSFPFFLVIAYSKNGWTDFHDVYLKQCRFAQGCVFWGSRWRKIMIIIIIFYLPDHKHNNYTHIILMQKLTYSHKIQLWSPHFLSSSCEHHWMLQLR